MHSGKWVKMLKELGFIPGRPKSARVPGPKGAAISHQLGSPVALGSVEGCLGVVDNQGPRNGKKIGK